MDEILPDFDGQSTDTYLSSSALSTKDDMEFDNYFTDASIGSSPTDTVQRAYPHTSLSLCNHAVTLSQPSLPSLGNKVSIGESVT